MLAERVKEGGRRASLGREAVRDGESVERGLASGRALAGHLDGLDDVGEELALEVERELGQYPARFECCRVGAPGAGDVGPQKGEERGSFGPLRPECSGPFGDRFERAEEEGGV